MKATEATRASQLRALSCFGGGIGKLFDNLQSAHAGATPRNRAVGPAWKRRVAAQKCFEKTNPICGASVCFAQASISITLPKTAGDAPQRRVARRWSQMAEFAYSSSSSAPTDSAAASSLTSSESAVSFSSVAFSSASVCWSSLTALSSPSFSASATAVP